MATRHDQVDYRLPPPCAGCGERLGAYEPIVISEHAKPTSWLRLRHEGRMRALRAWHPSCVPGDDAEPVLGPGAS